MQGLNSLFSNQKKIKAHLNIFKTCILKSIAEKKEVRFFPSIFQCEDRLEKQASVVEDQRHAPKERPACT